MSLRHIAPLWLLLAGACTFDASGSGGFGELGSTGMPTATGDDDTGAANGSSGTASTGIADGSGDGSTTTSAETTADGSSSSSTSTGPSDPVCGNGIVEPGEVCDDGNDDEVECTSQCVAPACDDREQNGDESDVDCGGSACDACALCQTCVAETDCDDTMTCTEAGQCATYVEVNVDYAANCGGIGSGTPAVNLPAGTYVAVASPSAGSLWNPNAHDPPSSGYIYDVDCAGMTFMDMRTPEGQAYDTPANAFAAMGSTEETFDYLGGDFSCWVDDMICGDNSGNSEFSLLYQCEE